MVDVPAIRALVRVNCSATGLPLPTITWYKNNVSISVFNNVTRDEVTSELVIGQFQPSDQATYKCVARNMYNDEVNATTNVGKESRLSLKTSSSLLLTVLTRPERDCGWF